jgi:hypothetical protein
VGGCLVFLNQFARDASTVLDNGADSVFGECHKCINRRERRSSERQQISQNWVFVQRHILTIMRHLATPINLQVQR